MDNSLRPLDIVGVVFLAVGFVVFCCGVVANGIYKSCPNSQDDPPTA